MKIGIADYGMYVWYGSHFDWDERIDIANKLGYDGLERLYCTTAEDALTKAAKLKRAGMGFATCEASNPELSIKWSAALGAKYVWAGIDNSRGTDFDTYIRRLRENTRIAGNYGVKVAVHNHLGLRIETEEEIERMLEACPDTMLLFDVGHLAVAGGDVKKIMDTYYDRIVAYHIKGWKQSDTPDAEKWQKRGYFCGLNQGDFFIDNEYIFKTALKRGFDGWIMIEQDTHKREPILDLKENMEILKKWESEVK